MRMMQSILLATDFRPAGRDAEKAAVRLAAVFGSRLTVVHVIEPLPTWPVALHQQREQVIGPLRDLVEGLKAQKVEVADWVIPVGSPAETIIRKAADCEADMIVIGAGERSRFDRFSPGPIAEAILQHAEQPVLAVHPGAPALQFRNILCPVDHSPVSARGVRNAIKLARAFGSRLTVLSVIPNIKWLTTKVDKRSFQDEAHAQHRSAWQTEFESFLEAQPFEGVNWTKEVREGQPHEVIIAAAQQQEADLIVMGSTGRSGPVRIFLGSVTRRVLQQLPCSLLTVKRADFLENLGQNDVRHIQLLFAEGQALLKSDSFVPAVDKFRQLLGHHAFHVGAIEGLAKSYEGLGQTEAAAACRHRLQSIKEHGLG